MRTLPVLDVADNRRLSLWVAFSLVMLGGMGLDAVGKVNPWRDWTRLWLIGVVGLVAAAGLVRVAKPWIEARAITHYAQAAAREPGASPAVYRERAEIQTRNAMTFLPRYFLLAAAELVVLAAIAEGLRRQRLDASLAKLVLLGLTLVELVGFGFDLNPALSRTEFRPESPLIAYLRREAPTTS